MSQDTLPAKHIAGGEGRGARRGAARTWLLRIPALLGLAVLLWLGWCALRVGVSARLALQDVQRLRSLSTGSPAQAFAPLHDDVVALEVHLEGVRTAGRPFWWVLSRAGWLPGIGPDLAAVPPLLDMAVTLSQTGHEALNLLGPVALAAFDGANGDMLSRIVPPLAVAAPRLAPLASGLAEAEAARARIAGPLSPRFGRLMDQVDRMMSVARIGVQGAQIAPSLLGASGPRTYLILAQNNHELRATGGFITGVGIVRLDRGNIVEIRLSDSYAADNLDNPHPIAPRVLAEQMGAPMLVLRDSNWSPDFPTSAQVARSLYEQDQGVATDGAIAVDLEAVRLLVGAIGPLSIPSRSVPITGDNVIEQIKQSWATPDSDQGGAARGSDWWLKRKDFMGPLMTAALSRLQSGGNLHPAALASAIVQMLDERHVQISMDDPQAATALAGYGWDGALRLPARGDFLAVVDTNLGFNKVNAAVRQEITYRVEREPGASTLLATLTLAYVHPAAPISLCDRTPRYGETYDDLIDRCYWDHLRVYVPPDSVLVSADGLQNAQQDRGEAGATVMSGDMLLEPGQGHTVTLRYRLPETAGSAPYRLLVRAQAGAMAPSLTVEAGPCRWQTDLSRDRNLECSRWN